jgi:hypothetical protein
MGKGSRRHLIEPRLSALGDDTDTTDFDTEVEDTSAQAEGPSGHLRSEARNERMHVRVQLPFQAVIDGRRYAGHDVSVSGFSTVKRPQIEPNTVVQCDLYIRCNGFRAAIQTTAKLLGDRGDNQGARFEFTEIDPSEASILRRLIRSHLAGVHLTLEQLAAKEDPQTVRERVRKTIRPPNPAPSLVRFGGTLAAIGVLLLVLGAALYERLFVIEPDFAAVTAPEIRIYAASLQRTTSTPGTRCSATRCWSRSTIPRPRRSWCWRRRPSTTTSACWRTCARASRPAAARPSSPAVATTARR